MNHFILECCVDSVESALNAARGGASRLELCGNLPIGGTTPGMALLHRIRKETDIRIHALIRPRFGDFCYSQYELDMMCEEIRTFREEGSVQAVVIGALNADGDLDLKAMEKMMQEAGDMDVTLHRAFDMCRNPVQALEESISLGVNTILTSGQQQSSWAGRELICQMIEQADGRIDIMAGGGVGADVIRKLRPITGGTSYHMSGKITLDSPMRYRKAEVSMGLPSLSEYEIWQTSEENVRKAIQVLREID